MNPKNSPPRYRVLLVDDHAPLAEATAEFMHTKGFDVRIASTGSEVLELVAAFHPEIVLCDMNLPDMSGIDVARALHAMPGAKTVVIAIHTAMTESDLRMLGRCEDAAVDLFISKPITEDKIDRLISQVQSRAQRKKR
jgi:CheY-like chemotaxis protein